MAEQLQELIQRWFTGRPVQAAGAGPACRTAGPPEFKLCTRCGGAPA
jgi:hypothetical protein